MKTRQYRQKRRKESAEETHRRIVDAVVELHATIGPAKTTIQAIAKQAGVQRLTVYRHLPDETTLYRACSSRYLEQNPLPDVAEWRHLEEPADRTRTALTALYGFYRRTQGVWRNSYRDADDIEPLKAMLAEVQQWLDGVRDDLLKTWRPSRSSRAAVQAVLGHALHFTTWDSLQSQGLADAAIAEAVEKWLRAL
ncbi:MAG: TetR/AcrR family transcriptional regulator [Planctomycetes bacterium]|nr:TetR/AcrR family transcriptional regulator [Planctomycetota bacterium]